jgi:hypothetical protein
MTLKISIDAATLKEIACDYGVDVDVDMDKSVKELLAGELANGFAKDMGGKMRLSPDVSGLVGDWVRRLVATEVGNYLRVGQTAIRAEIMKQVDGQLEKEIRNAVSSRMRVVTERTLKMLESENE